jgi:hypothetical protein
MVVEDHAPTIATTQWEVITAVADMDTTCLDDTHVHLLTVVDHQFQVVQEMHTGISSVLPVLQFLFQHVQPRTLTTAI